VIFDLVSGNLYWYAGGSEALYGGVVAARALLQVLAVGSHVISVEVYGK
jgi:hypothetical protein